MANDPEARTQLARLLGDGQLRFADADEVREAIDQHLEGLADGLLEEAAASDDVVDAESAREFIELLVSQFGTLISRDQTRRLFEAVQRKIEAW